MRKGIKCRAFSGLSNYNGFGGRRERCSGFFAAGPENVEFGDLVGRREQNGQAVLRPVAGAGVEFFAGTEMAIGVFSADDCADGRGVAGWSFEADLESRRGA